MAAPITSSDNVASVSGGYAVSDIDPYRPPAANIRRPDAADEERGMFGLPAIALASVVGSVFAGTVVIALNYAAQKQRGTAWAVALLIGPALTTAMLTALLIGSRILHIAPTPLWLGAWLAQPLLMTALAALLQGKAIKQRLRAGRPMASNVLALVIAVALLPVLALLVAPVSALLMGLIWAGVTSMH